MPELPEVETVRKTLISWSKDKVIKDVYLHYDKVLEDISFESFKEALIIGEVILVSIKSVDRYFVTPAILTSVPLEGHPSS